MEPTVHKRSKNVITFEGGGLDDTDILSTAPERVGDSASTKRDILLKESAIEDTGRDILSNIIKPIIQDTSIKTTEVKSENDQSLNYHTNVSEEPHSIFDIRTNHTSKKKVTFPQILTVFASETDKLVIEKEAKDCILPSILENNHNEIEKLENLHKKSPSKSSKKKTKQLFDFRALETQELARKKQIRRLRQQGYNVSRDSHIDSRFVAKPYEGSCDNISKIKNISPKVSPISSNSSSPQIKQKQFGDKYTTIADQDTLDKIEAAFSEWNARKLREEKESSKKTRKRSSSHSPTRTSPQSSTYDKTKYDEYKSLNHAGNLRHRQFTKPGSKESSLGTTYRAIASPACSRRRLLQRPLRTSPIASPTTVIKSTITPIQSSTSTTRLSGLSPNSFSSRTSTKISDQNRNLIHVLARNKALQESEGRFSSSLPALDLHTPNKALVEMDRKGHRPRTSSLNKPRPPSVGKSPKPARKKTPKKEEAKHGQNDKGKEGDKRPASPSTRRVMLNTQLPTASPTFQRAMKGMKLPEKDYSEIFVRNRRDSILQSYTIPEKALNSFRDDHELDAVESSSNNLEEMTKRFRDDLKGYKDGWHPKTEEKQRKSILKKRRQSVDDMEISTRKNLAKYLESKLDISGAGTLPSKELSFS